MTEKEFLYVGHYTDTEGFFVLKVGTTNDLERRAQEHTRNYRRAKTHTMPPNQKFEYDWHLPLSRYNTHRYEDRNIERLKSLAFGEYLRNDRFCFAEKPACVQIVIRKTYEIAL